MPLGDIVEAEGGDQILTGKGWVPLTPELEAAASMGWFGAFTQNAVEMMSFGLFTPQPGLDEVSPAASKAGSAAGVLAPIAPPLFNAALRSVRAVRGARAGGTVAELEAATQGGGAGARGGGLFKTEQGFLKRPSDLSPEALRGTVQAIEAGAGSIPVLRIGTDLINIQKRRVMGGKVGRVLGMSDEEIRAAGGKLRPADVEPALSRIDDAYEGARNLVSQRVTTQQVEKLGREALEQKFITEAELARLGRATDATGDTLFDLRTAVRSAGRQAASRQERQRAAEIIDNINELIKQSARGTDSFAQLAVADRQWKAWNAVNKGGVVNGEGWLNLNSLKTNLSSKKAFGPRVGRGGSREGLRAVEVDMFNAIDELGPINFQIPSSGTTERLIGASLIGGALGIPILGVGQ